MAGAGSGAGRGRAHRARHRLPPELVGLLRKTRAGQRARTLPWVGRGHRQRGRGRPLSLDERDARRQVTAVPRRPGRASCARKLGARGRGGVRARDVRLRAARSRCRSPAPSAPVTRSLPASSAALHRRPAAGRLPAPRQRGGGGAWSSRVSCSDAMPYPHEVEAMLPAADPARLHLPAGSATDGSDPVLVTPALAGWSFSGLRVLRLGAGASRAVDTGPNEMVVLPLAGSATVRADGHRFRLRDARPSSTASAISRTSRGTPGSRSRPTAAASSRCPWRSAPAPGARVRTGRACARGDPRRGRRHPPGHELLHAGAASPPTA